MKPIVWLPRTVDVAATVANWLDPAATVPELGITAANVAVPLVSAAERE